MRVLENGFSEWGRSDGGWPRLRCRLQDCSVRYFDSSKSAQWEKGIDNDISVN